MYSDAHSLPDTFSDFVSMTRPLLISLAILHGLDANAMRKRENIRSMIIEHLAVDRCGARLLGSTPIACASSVESYRNPPGSELNDTHLDISDMQIRILLKISPKLTKPHLQQVLDSHSVGYSTSDGVAKLRKILKNFIHTVSKGKSLALGQAHNNQRVIKEFRDRDVQRKQVVQSWPQVLSKTLSYKVVSMFKSYISKDTLSSFTCACCAESCLNISRVAGPAAKRATSNMEILE